jgi:hypothetical protein
MDLDRFLVFGYKTLDISRQQQNTLQSLKTIIEEHCSMQEFNYLQRFILGQYHTLKQSSMVERTSI